MLDESESAREFYFEIHYDVRDGGSLVRVPCSTEALATSEPVKYSFEELCVPLRGELTCYAAQLANNDLALAEDVVQDSFIKALNAWPTWAPTHDLPEVDARGWMYRIVCHRFMSMYRTMTRHASVMKEARIDPTTPYRLGGKKIDGTPAPAEGEDYSDEMLHALSNLSPERQAVVQLCGVEGKTPTEAARILGIPLNTVHTRLYRAYEKMRESLRVAKAAPAVMRRRRVASSRNAK